MVTFRAFCRDETGVTAVEYGLLAGLLTVIIITALTTLGTGLTSIFNRLSTAFAPRV